VSPWCCGPGAVLMLRPEPVASVWGQARSWSPGTAGLVHSLCRRQTTAGWTATGRVEWSGRAGTDLLDQLGDLLVNLSPFLHLAGDLVDGVDHGRVIAIAEDPPDSWIAVVRELSG